ncbi:MAG: phosphoenolpyruvate--protein phosphotransferase [Deltaproteobacteria bacterium]|nr:phosphoenolpyruvate--protein phosphotransferase [Deltaproteobacteria bacterium]
MRGSAKTAERRKAAPTRRRGRPAAKPSFAREPIVLHGIGVAPGIVIGKAFLLDRGPAAVARRKLRKPEVDAEVRRFRKALKEAKQDLMSLRAGIPDKDLRDHLFILDTYVMILDDRMIAEETAELIRAEKINAEAALTQQLDKLKKIFDGIQDPYLRERRRDLDHVGGRVLMRLTGQTRERLAEVPEKVVVVAHDLSPADTAQMTPDRVAGFLTDVGGPTSHTAIMARALEITAVVGLENVTRRVESGCPLIVDGRVGKVILYPSRDDYAHYLRLVDRLHRFEQDLAKDLHLPAVTLDGERVQLAANIEMNREIPAVIEAGGEGIGLYRTEFLYMNRNDLPGEEEQFAVYREVAERTAPHPAVIRTLDLGGDKVSALLELAPEVNPALGLRAIRLCLKHPELFKVQLRGILRASAFGRLHIMLPMVSGLAEVRASRRILEEVKADLRSREIAFDERAPLGCMIETPSSATIVDLIAREVDFLSIGTNDLIQYALAIDRVNEQIADLYQPTHPAILRMIRGVVEAGRDARIPVSLCGEMASDGLYTMLLLGMGLDSLSMTPNSISVIKRIVRSVTRLECRKFVDEVMQLDDADAILARLRQEMALRYPEMYASD